MVAIYADNLARLRSDYFRVLRDVVPPCGQWYTIIMTPSVTFVIALATSKASGPSASSTSSRMVDSSASSVENTRTTHASSTNETVEMDEVPCGAHIMKQPLIATPTAVPGGANELTAALKLLPPGLRASRESAGPMIFGKKRASQNAPTSPSHRRRYTPRRQLQRSKATRRRPDPSAYCQHRALGHLRNAPSPPSLWGVRKIGLLHVWENGW